MFDRIFHFIVTFWDLMRPWFIIAHYERGIILRLGKPTKSEKKPGIHFKIPIIDELMVDNVVPRTLNCGTQTLCTADGEYITIKLIIAVTVFDVQKALLEVENVDDATWNMTIGAAGDAVSELTLEECKEHDRLANRILEIANEEILRFGIVIESCQLAEFAKARAIRLLQN